VTPTHERCVRDAYTLLMQKRGSGDTVLVVVLRVVVPAVGIVWLGLAFYATQAHFLGTEAAVISVAAYFAAIIAIFGGSLWWTKRHPRPARPVISKRPLPPWFWVLLALVGCALYATALLPKH
jgi:uncharacterized iron-regulated membrane protein